MSDVLTNEVILTNEVTGQAYQGGNINRLLASAVEHGYSEQHGWAGFHQWIGAGRVVRRGEHGTHCLTVVTVERNEDGTGGKRKPRGFVVFHFDQTDTLTSP